MLLSAVLSSSSEETEFSDIKVLADAIPQLVWMAQPDGWIFWYNQRWHEYTGTTSAQMEGWGWQSVHDPAMLPLVMERWRSSIQTGDAFEMEFPLRAADGHFGWFLTRVSPLKDRDGTIVRWYGTNTDISELKDAEQVIRSSEDKLRRSEDKLRIALDAAQLGVWDWDLLTGELVWSDRCRNIFGVPADVQITYDTFLSTVHPDDRGWVEQAVRDAQRTGTEYNVVMRVNVPGGSVRSVAANGRVFFDAAGNQVRMAGVAQDITERQAVEERVRQAQKLESLGLLAGGVAHDFNNLLTGIMGGASMALEVAGADARLKPLLENVLLSSRRAAELTRQMLAYSGRGRFLLELADLSEQVRITLPLVEHFVSKKVAVTLTCAEDLPPIHADASQLQQVIMNLLTNAGEAIGDKTGTILVSTSREELDEKAARKIAQKWSEFSPGAYIVLRVRDSGDGMDDKTQAKIFDPFFTTKMTGRGLGLAAIQGIVRGHKGAIQVTSTPGKGTLFEVLFPASVQRKTLPIAPAKSAAAVVPHARERQTILVVDDEEIILRVTRAVLESKGYAVLSASGAGEAIQIFRTRADEISLVLLDLSMPGMSGKECLPVLRSIKEDCRVLISSGFNESEVIGQFEDGTITGVMAKPYSAAGLVAAVRSALTS